MTEPDRPGQYPSGAFPGSYPPPPPVPYEGYTAPPPPPKNALGTAALVIAIIALVSVWSVVGGLVLGLLAVLLGISGRGRVKRKEATNGSVAVAGIALGALAIALSVLFTAIWFSLFESVGGGDYIDCLKNAKHEAAVRQCEDEIRQRIENEFSITLGPQPSS